MAAQCETPGHWAPVLSRGLIPVVGGFWPQWHHLESAQCGLTVLYEAQAYPSLYVGGSLKESSLAAPGTLLLPDTGRCSVRPRAGDFYDELVTVVENH